jgi:hypothetical protein
MAIANDMSERQRFRRASDPGSLGGLSGALLGVPYALKDSVAQILAPSRYRRDCGHTTFGRFVSEPPYYGQRPRLDLVAPWGGICTRAAQGAK